MAGASKPPLPFGLAAAALALVVFVPAAALAAWHSFDGLYGQDAWFYAWYAIGPASEAISGLHLPPSAHWPPGYPLIVAALALPSGLEAFAGQLVSLVSGALLPVAVALLARELVSPAAPPRWRYWMPLAAGLIMALAGQLWQSSVVIMSDTTAAALATLGAWAVCRSVRNGSVVALALGAGGLAAAIEVRWIYGLVALPVAVPAIVQLIRAARSAPWRAAGQATAAALVALVVLSPMLLPILGAALAGRELPFTGNFGVNTWSPANLLASTFETRDGQLAYSLPTSLFYMLQPLQHYWFFAPGLLALPGLAWVARRPTTSNAAVLVAWPAAVILFLAGAAYQNTRFLLAAAPPLAILIAIGGLLVIEAIAGVSVRWRGAARVFLGLALAAGLLTNGLLALRFTDGFVTRVASDVRDMRGLVAQVPAGAQLISLGATPMIMFDGSAKAVELYDLDAESALALTADGATTFLLVEMEAMRSQWAGHRAGRAVAALEGARGLQAVDSAGSWTLYRVGRPYDLGQAHARGGEPQ